MILFAPYLLFVAAHLVHPAAEPQLKVEPSCRAASNLAMAYGQSFRECMQDELEAKGEVAKNWTSYRAAARSRCSAEVTIGGDPSYVDLLECLELDKSLSRQANDKEGADGPGLSANTFQDDTPQR